MKQLAALLLMLTALVGAALAAEGGFVVSKVSTASEKNGYFIDVEVDYVFSETALEALDNGVPLTLDLHYQLRRKGAWIWEDNLVDRNQLYLIRYLPLTKLYQVVRLPDGDKQSFYTRAAAISALGESGRLPMVPQSTLDPDEDYQVRVKVSLDIESLPLPLRPVAYLKPSWKLTSGWTRWPLER